jgi:hypothetical protein
MLGDATPWRSYARIVSIERENEELSLFKLSSATTFCGETKKQGSAFSQGRLQIGRKRAARRIALSIVSSLDGLTPDQVR